MAPRRARRSGIPDWLAEFEEAQQPGGIEELETRALRVVEAAKPRSPQELGRGLDGIITAVNQRCDGYNEARGVAARMLENAIACHQVTPVTELELCNLPTYQRHPRPLLRAAEVYAIADPAEPQDPHPAATTAGACGCKPRPIIGRFLSRPPRR